MNQDLLLEIGCEELPPFIIDRSLEQLKEKLESFFATASIPLSHPIETYGTLRRLVVHVPALPEKQADRQNEITGPPHKVAYDAAGNPTKAGLGFASKMGVSIDILEIKETERGNYLLFREIQTGRTTHELLQEALPEIIQKISFPKTMRWAAKNIRFSRPIRWILALLGNSVISFSLDGIESGSGTYGHARLNGQSHSVSSFREYQEYLTEKAVILGIAEREKSIAEKLRDEAEKQGGKLIDDPALLKTVARCSEFPEVIYGKIKPAFLDLPRAVLITSMRTHQKFFALEDENGKLLPGFLYVTDNPRANKSLVIQGNEKVLEARLTDAQFFYAEDVKVPLQNRFQATSGIVLHEKLGSMADKTERLDKLSPLICESLFPDQYASLLPFISSANKMVKTDLTTLMVGEFPELQGMMGKVYALVQNEDSCVAEAIYEHYLPRWAGDKLPESPLGIVLSIADRLDTISGYFSINLVPSGSEDPYALRRQVIGILNIIIQKGLRTDVRYLIKNALISYRNQGLSFDEKNVIDSLTLFFQKRLEAFALEQKYVYDNINACLAVSWFDPIDFFARVEALTAFRSRADFEDLIVAFRRAARIIPPDFNETFDESFLTDEAEKKLYADFVKTEPEVTELLEKGFYEKAFEGLAEVKPAVDNFFESVMVMCDDRNIRNNRLALLRKIVVFFTSIADFQLIVISQDKQ